MDFFTGYNPELERRDEIANSSTPMLFTMRDFAAPVKAVNVAKMLII